MCWGHTRWGLRNRSGDLEGRLEGGGAGHQSHPGSPHLPANATRSYEFVWGLRRGGRRVLVRAPAPSRQDGGGWVYSSGLPLARSEAGQFSSYCISAPGCARADGPRKPSRDRGYCCISQLSNATRRSNLSFGGCRRGGLREGSLSSGGRRRAIFRAGCLRPAAVSLRVPVVRRCQRVGRVRPVPWSLRPAPTSRSRRTRTGVSGEVDGAGRRRATGSTAGRPSGPTLAAADAGWPRRVFRTSLCPDLGTGPACLRATSG